MRAPWTTFAMWVFALSLCAGAGAHAGTRDSPPPIDDVTALDRALAQGELGSVDDVLARLSRDMRDSPVFVFASRSNQPASPSAPRLVFSARQGRFLVALATAVRSADEDDVEVISFDEASRRFRFLRVVFPSGRPPVVERDPPQCGACHGSPARPNWDPYPNWPGVYGSADNSLHTPAGAALLAAETDAYANFLRSASKGAPFVPARLSHVDWSSPLAWLEKGPHAAFQHRQQRNTAFTLEIAGLNFLRMRREIEVRLADADVPPEWRQHAFAWLRYAQKEPARVLARDPRLEPYDARFASRVSAISARVRERTRARVAQHALDIVERHNATSFSPLLLTGVEDLRTFGGKPWPDDRDADVIAAFLCVAEALGVDTEAWSMGFTSTPFQVGADTFSTGFHGIRDFFSPRPGPY